jgi:protein-L-isoaspartate(D-aspartate) O-methyltransferase
VISIEVVTELHDEAVARLAELDLRNVTCLVADGWQGLPERAPYDAINVAAASGREPPAALLAQLAAGGRMVLPIGRRRQRLTVLRRADDGTVSTEILEPVRFVPLVRSGPEP